MYSDDESEKTSHKSAKRHKIFKYFLGIAVVLVSLGFTIGVLYSIIDYYVNEEDVSQPGMTTFASTTQEESHTTPNEINMESIYEITEGDLTKYFVGANEDGLNINFYHGANSKHEMDEALQGDYHVLEADISLSPDTNEPIMAHPPIITSDNTLHEWFESVTKSNKAIKMDIKSNEVIEPALNTLRSFVEYLHQPVWINADIVKGPNTNNDPISENLFLSTVNGIFPNVTLSLGWTTGFRPFGDNAEYSWDSMDEMYEKAKQLNQKVTFPARAALVKNSWYKFLWLLEQDERFSLTIWTGSTDPVDTKDMVYIRNNFVLSKVFYDAYTDLTDPLKQAVESGMYPKVFYSGGNALDFLRISNREALAVTWAHRVNSQADLRSAIEDDSIMMLEADVRLYAEGTANVNESLPVMAHDVIDASTSDLTLEEFLLQVSNSNKTKGVKLDFKSIGSVRASVQFLQQLKPKLSFPVWINADVLLGPNALTQPVNASEFFSTINDNFFDCTFSPGWTTAYNPVGVNEHYTSQMVEEMYNYCSSLRQAITFPVRASLTRASIQPLQWLLSKSNRYSLTVWHSSPGPEGVTDEDLFEIYSSFPKDKVYFDIPADMMEGLRALIDSRIV